MIDVLKAIALDRLAADVGLADHLIDDELPPCPQWFCDIMDEYKAAVEAAAPERQAAPIAGIRHQPSRIAGAGRPSPASSPKPSSSGSM